MKHKKGRLCYYELSTNNNVSLQLPLLQTCGEIRGDVSWNVIDRSPIPDSAHSSRGQLWPHSTSQITAMDKSLQEFLDMTSDLSWGLQQQLFNRAPTSPPTGQFRCRRVVISKKVVCEELRVNQLVFVDLCWRKRFYPKKFLSAVLLWSQRKKSRRGIIKVRGHSGPWVVLML